MNIEDLIKDSVDEMVRDVPARTNLADDALRRARRGQHVTRLTVASGATLALVGGAVAVTDPLGLWAQPSSSKLGPQSGQGQEDPGEDASPTGSGVIDIEELSLGAAPDVPWYADGAVHLGDTAVPFDVEFAELRDLEPVTGGAVALTVPDNDGAHKGFGLYLIKEDGEVWDLAESFFGDAAVSGDGTLVAWSDEAWGPGPGDGPSSVTLRVAETATGEVVATKQQTGSGGDFAGVAAFLDNDRVVLDSTDNSPDGVYLWDLTADTVTPWLDYGFTRTFAPSSDVGAFVKRNGADGANTYVVDTATEQVLWSTEDSVASFSPDGRYAALTASQGPSRMIDGFEAMLLRGYDPGDVIEVNGEDVTITREMLDAAAEWQEWHDNWDGRSDLVIVDARTGQEVVRFDVTYPQRIAWEPDGTLVFEAWRDVERMALVRCTVDGECELATEPREAKEHPGAFRPPYNLGENH